MSQPGADTDMSQPGADTDISRNPGHQLDLNPGHQLDLNGGNQSDLKRGHQLALNLGHQLDLNQDTSWISTIVDQHSEILRGTQAGHLSAATPRLLRTRKLSRSHELGIDRENPIRVNTVWGKTRIFLLWSQNGPFGLTMS